MFDDRSLLSDGCCMLVAVCCVLFRVCGYAGLLSVVVCCCLLLLCVVCRSAVSVACRALLLVGRGFAVIFFVGCCSLSSNTCSECVTVHCEMLIA